MDEHLYVVAYYICDSRRWRRVFRLMHGYGEWVQLSVFQTRLSRRRQAELVALLDEIIDHARDHVILIDVGPADSVRPRVISLGRDFQPLVRGSIIV